MQVTISGLYTAFRYFSSYFSCAISREKSTEDQSNYFCLRLLDFKLSFSETISKWRFACNKRSTLHSPLIAPSHIAGDGFALGLGEGCEERSHHFTGHCRSVNVLFLEVDADTE